MATTCINCGCSKPKCGCQDTMLTTPAPCPTPIGCPDPEPCSEVFDAQCVIYTGPNVVCDQTTIIPSNTSVADAISLLVDFICQCCNSGGNVTVVEAGTGIDVTSVTVGNTTTYTVSLEAVPAKDIEYTENIETFNISTGITPSVYSFPTAGYSSLQYTNTSATVKVYKVYATYDTNMSTFSPNNSDIGNWVDGAIIKTVSAVDTVLWESLGNTKLNGFLFWGPNGSDTIGSGTPVHLLLDNQGAEVDFRFLSASFPRNVSFFQLVTLNPGETVSLKFKTKDGSTPSFILKAQLLVEEV